MLCPFESEDAMREGALHFVSLITGSWLYLGLAQELELGCICDPLPVAQRAQIARKTATMTSTAIASAISSFAVSHK